MKTDSGGNLEWTKIIGESSKSELAYDLEITGTTAISPAGSRSHR